MEQEGEREKLYLYVRNNRHDGTGNRRTKKEEEKKEKKRRRKRRKKVAWHCPRPRGTSALQRGFFFRFQSVHLSVCLSVCLYVGQYILIDSRALKMLRHSLERVHVIDR